MLPRCFIDLFMHFLLDRKFWKGLNFRRKHPPPYPNPPYDHNYDFKKRPLVHFELVKHILFFQEERVAGGTRAGADDTVIWPLGGDG